MNKIYDVCNLRVTTHSISFDLSGSRIDIPMNKTGSKILPQAKPEYLRIFEMDQDGIGIYWPMLDEDLSIEGLLKAGGRADLIVKNIPSLYRDEPSKGNSLIHHVKQAVASA